MNKICSRCHGLGIIVSRIDPVLDREYFEPRRCPICKDDKQEEPAHQHDLDVHLDTKTYDEQIEDDLQREIDEIHWNLD